MNVLRVGMLFCLLGGLAAAEPDRELAQQRYRTGQALFQRGRVPEALREFEEGKKAFPLPEFDYNIGLCLAKLDRPGEAADALQSYIVAKPEDPEAASIWRNVAELRAEAARRKPPPEPAASPAPTLTAPILAPPPRDDGRRTTFTRAAIATATVGGVLLLAGIATGSIALNARDNYDTSCDGGRCMDADYERAHRLAIGTDVLLPIGAALVVTSIVLFVKRPPAAPRVAWGLTF